jgi:hypothetical protein
MTLVYWLDAHKPNSNIHFRRLRIYDTRKQLRNDFNGLEDPSEPYTEHLWISECNEVVLEALKIRIHSEVYEYEGGWARIAVVYDFDEQVVGGGTAITLMLNDKTVGTGATTYSVYEQEDVESMYFGRGLVNVPDYNFNGFIWSIEYWPMVKVIDKFTFGKCKNCSLCPGQNTCLNHCKLNEWMNQDGSCTECEQCNLGCMSDLTC